MAKKHVKMVKDMYDDSITAVRCAAGMTECFGEEVGLHSGSALSPFLFAVVVDRLTDDQKGIPTNHDVCKRRRFVARVGKKWKQRLRDGDMNWRGGD